MRITFDDFALDTDCHQLEKHGKPVHLQPQAFRLLCYLVEAAPVAISRAHLYDLLWGETHVVEANLRNLIADLRAAMGDCRTNPRYIASVHGFGYRFVAKTVTELHPYQSDFLLDGGESHFSLKQGPNIVGRDPGADICLDHPDVSRVHAAIVVCGDEVWIEHRANGSETCVGDEPITESVLLRQGQVIRIGPASLTLRSMVAVK